MTEWSEDGGQKKNKRERAEFGGLVNHATSPPLINYAGPPSSFPSSPSSLAASLYEQVDMSAFVRSHFIRLELRRWLNGDSEAEGGEDNDDVSHGRAGTTWSGVRHSPPSCVTDWRGREV